MNIVKALMVLKGIKQKDICRELNVKPPTVSLVVSGKAKSKRIRRAICKATGLPWSIWEEIDQERQELDREKKIA